MGHVADHRRVRQDRDPAGRQSDDQDPNHDHQQGEHPVHPDADRHHQGAVLNDRGLTKRNDPCVPLGSHVAHHPGVGHEHHHQGDAPAAAELGCHLAAAESCDHQQARRADQTVRCRAAAPECRVLHQDARSGRQGVAREDDSSHLHQDATTPHAGRQ